MEEKIIEILMKGEMKVDDGYGGSHSVLMTEYLGDEVKEISSLFTAFTNWLLVNARADFDIEDGKCFDYWNVTDHQLMLTSEEIFQYWLDNIYNK